MKSSQRETPWSIGDLADRFGIETHVLRHWEDRGLITPARDGAGRRRYAEADAYRVAGVIASKAAGMSLEQVRVLMDSRAEDRRRILRDHLGDIERRIADLERSRHMTEHAMECRAADITNCPNFRSNVADIVAGNQRGLWSRTHAMHDRSPQRNAGSGQ